MSFLINRPQGKCYRGDKYSDAAGPVHLILAPASAQALPRAVGEAHRRYTGYINARERVTGHLFQGRFHCVAMDEPHTLAAIR